MVSTRVPGTTGRSGKAQNLHDGTSIRGLSPRQGPIKLAVAPSDSLDLDQMLRQLREAASAVDFQKIVTAVLGPHCFSLGVVAGIGVDVVTSAADLLKLAKTLALADLHDIRMSKVSWWRLHDPTYGIRLLAAELAGLVFPEELRAAGEERDALIKEFKEILQNPKAFFEGLTEQVVEGYRKDWEDFNKHMSDGTLEGQFRGGMIFGRVIVDVLALITGVVGAAKTGAKLLSKLPRLVKLARSAKLGRGAKSVPALAVAGESGELVRVGRWMKKQEYDDMVRTGRVQESPAGGAKGVLYPSNPASYKAAPPGDIYVEFDVPKASLQGKSAGQMAIPGPNSPQGRLAVKKGLPAPQMPPATNIKIVPTK